MFREVQMLKPSLLKNNNPSEFLTENENYKKSTHKFESDSKKKPN